MCQTPFMTVIDFISYAPVRHPARHTVLWCHWYICLVVSHLSCLCNVQGYIYPGRVYGSRWAGLTVTSRAEREVGYLFFLLHLPGPAPDILM